MATEIVRDPPPRHGLRSSSIDPEHAHCPRSHHPWRCPPTSRSSTDDRLPDRGQEGALRVHHQADQGPRVEGGVRVPGEYMFKDVPDEDRRRRDDPVAVTLREMDKLRHREGADRRRRATRLGSGRSSEHPDRFFAARQRRPQRRHGRASAQIVRGATRSTASAPSTCSRAGTFPQVAINDKKMYPIYAKCVELDIPIFVLRRRARAAAEVRRRSSVELHRRGDVRLPRAEVRDPPRLRAVGRPRGEADAQVAEPPLLDDRVRAEALPEGDHRLRQHPRRRQDHLRRLLPDGPVARAHLHRDAERAVPRPRVAEVPARERGAGPQARQ